MLDCSNRVLNVSDSLGDIGTIQWELALCLLFCWVVVFVCLLRGIRTSGKVSGFLSGFSGLYAKCKSQCNKVIFKGNISKVEVIGIFFHGKDFLLPFVSDVIK